MGQKDITEKVLEDYNDVFADIINGLLKWSTVYSSVQRVPSYNYGVENNSIHR